MDPKDQLELDRYRLTDRVKNSVESELKKKYAWMGIIAFFITVGFISLSVRTFLSNATDEIASAKAIQESAAERLVEASIKMDEIRIEVSKSKADFDKKINLAILKLDEVNKNADDIERLVAKANKENINIANKFQKDLKSVNEIVKQLVDQSDVNKEKISLIEKVNRTEQSISQSNSYIEQVESTFQSFINPVLLQSYCLGSELAPLLNSNGFRTEITNVDLGKNFYYKFQTYITGPYLDDTSPIGLSLDCRGHKAIRFTNLHSLSPDSCIRLIRLVKSYWPDLEYIFSTEPDYSSNKQEKTAQLSNDSSTDEVLVSDLFNYQEPILEKLNYSAMIGVLQSNDPLLEKLNPFNDNEFEMLFSQADSSTDLSTIIPILYMEPRINR